MSFGRYFSLVLAFQHKDVQPHHVLPINGVVRCFGRRCHILDQCAGKNAVRTSRGEPSTTPGLFTLRVFSSFAILMVLLGSGKPFVIRQQKVGDWAGARHQPNACFFLQK